MEDRLDMARESYTVAYVTAVCIATVLYDYVLTLGDEIRRMWPSRWSIPKILFMINRYVVLPMLVRVFKENLPEEWLLTWHISKPLQGIIFLLGCACSSIYGGVRYPQEIFPGSCVFYLRWLVVVITVTNAVVEGILLSRVIALCRFQYQAVKAAAVFLYAGGVITLTGLTIKDYVGETVKIVEDFSSLPGCYAASVPRIIAGYWITPTIIESTFFGLVLWRAIAWSREYISVPRTLHLIARDSTVYFAIIFIFLFVNLFVFEYGPPFLSSMSVAPMISAGCIAGSRMLLNLRGLAEVDADENYKEMELTRLCCLDPYLDQVTHMGNEGPPVTTSS